MARRMLHFGCWVFHGTDCVLAKDVQICHKMNYILKIKMNVKFSFRKCSACLLNMFRFPKFNFDGICSDAVNICML